MIDTLPAGIRRTPSAAPKLLHVAGIDLLFALADADLSRPHVSLKLAGGWLQFTGQGRQLTIADGRRSHLRSRTGPDKLVDHV